MDTIKRVTYRNEFPESESTNSKYDKQAFDWLEATDSILSIAFDHTGKYFPDDKEDRDIYKVRLCHCFMVYEFTFGQSIFSSTKGQRQQPSAYSILACLEKYNPGVFEDFCDERGYDTDSRKAEKIYRVVVDQWLQLSRMYSSDQLEALAGIQ